MITEFQLNVTWIKEIHHRNRKLAHFKVRPGMVYFGSRSLSYASGHFLLYFQTAEIIAFLVFNVHLGDHAYSDHLL